MSRNIIIKANYLNNRSIVYGVHNSKNKEYKLSAISYNDIIDCFEKFKKAIKNKNIKNIRVKHYNSGISNNIDKMTIYYDNINNISPCKLVDLNNALSIPFLD